MRKHWKVVDGLLYFDGSGKSLATAHEYGDPICFRNIFIRQIPRPEKFVSLFNGRDLTGWVGDTEGYVVEDGKIVCRPGGNLYTEKQYSDFVLRFEFKLTDGANNGLGIRTPLNVNAAYDGMELQILDNSADKYKDKLKLYQYHGSIYGIFPAKGGFLGLKGALRCSTGEQGHLHG